MHELKFQSVVVPNGLIAHLYGPVGKPLSAQFQVARQFRYTTRRPSPCILKSLIVVVVLPVSDWFPKFRSVNRNKPVNET